MPDLYQSFQGADFGHLKIIAEKWNLSLDAPDVRQAREELAAGILKREVFLPGLERLSEAARKALLRLEENEGRVRWFRFAREFGDIREMGAGRRERYRPDQSPVSPAEELWYTGLVARGFFSTESGPQEFVYLPEDLRPMIQEKIFKGSRNRPAHRETNLGRIATPEERIHQVNASDWILDHACTLLAASRMEIDPEPHLMSAGKDQIAFTERLLQEAELIQNQGPDLKRLRSFLKLDRGKGILHLWETWCGSKGLHDLRWTPGLILEGEGRDDPLQTRSRVLGWVSGIPADTWWSISSLTASIKQLKPDFLRVSGDYESWFIRDKEQGKYLRGFNHWDDVEGALIHYLIAGPGHWLGLFDLGFPDAVDNSRAAAFRLSPWASDLLAGAPPDLPREDDAVVQVRSRGTLKISRYVEQRVRYQISRFCEWLEPKQEQYMYRISPRSLTAAGMQELEVEHLLLLLENHADAVPPNLVTALQRWADHGVQVDINPRVVLRVSTPAVLEALKQSRAKRYLEEQLGPTTIVLREGGEGYVNDVLVEMGFLVNRDLDQ